MTRIILFPAILIAGSPNCGKSVLSYLLTTKLRCKNLSHYLLRAVPDGEGDWFLKGNLFYVRELRSRSKGRYSHEYVQHMCSIIDHRVVPLLVDIGGKPRGDQFDVFKTCTHYILLYKTSEEYDYWISQISKFSLQPIAEIRSSLVEPENIIEEKPVLRGIINGLERETEKRKEGRLFTALLERITGIFNYDQDFLFEEHLGTAPIPPVTENWLAKQLQQNPYSWQPESLSGIADILPEGRSIAVYGRGPVWLAAALAVHAFPGKIWLFDIRYGWQQVPMVRRSKKTNLDFYSPPSSNRAEMVEFKIKDDFLDPWDIKIADLRPNEGIIISGKLPRWTHAALARYFSERCQWVAVHDANKNQAIVVYSISDAHQVGETILLANSS